MNESADAPSWLELLVRMCAGEQSEEPFVGILEVTDVDGDDSFPGTVRVFKDRDRYRVETLDGRLLTIRQPGRTYVFHDQTDVPQQIDDDDEGGVHHGAHGTVIQRRHPTDWRGDDFTRPSGPVRETKYLGRMAWQVELMPPSRKSSALKLTIDPETGRTLEERSVEFGLLSRWLEIELVEQHPEHLFEWSGDAVVHWFGTSEVDEAEEAQDMADRARWMEARGLGPIDVTTRVELFPHEWGDDDGSFFASFNIRAHGIVARRPHRDDEWDLDAHYDHMERWSDDVWDWAIGTDEGLAQLAEIRRQLAEPPPES